MPTDIFLSHCWQFDSTGRDNHTRARKLCRHLRNTGLTVWFDEDNLKCGNIYSVMARGINDAEVMVVCITRKYIEKINNGLHNMRSIDNCACEWSCAIAHRKPIIAAIMEADMLDTTNWAAGPVSMHIGSNIYVDASGDDWNEITENIKALVRCISPMPSPKCFNGKYVNSRHRHVPPLQLAPLLKPAALAPPYRDAPWRKETLPMISPDCNIISDNSPRNNSRFYICGLWRKPEGRRRTMSKEKRRSIFTI